jgi:hypothetical protein
MTCSIGDHDEVNEELAKWGAENKLDVALAHDGLMLGAAEWMREAEGLAQRGGSVKAKEEARVSSSL